MTLHRHAVQIDGTPEQVLAYACDVSQWPQWHPSSLRIDGDTGPLAAGATFEEDVRAGGRTAHLIWRVTDYQPGVRWCAEAVDSANSLWLHVAYECRANAQGTAFERIMQYRVEGWLFRLLNRLVLQRKIERESRLSMANLKQVWEAQRATGASLAN